MGFTLSSLIVLTLCHVEQFFSEKLTKHYGIEKALLVSL